jgi:hypothetical protein
MYLSVSGIALVRRSFFIGRLRVKGKGYMKSDLIYFKVNHFF